MCIYTNQLRAATQPGSGDLHFNMDNPDARQCTVAILATVRGNVRKGVGLTIHVRLKVRTIPRRKSVIRMRSASRGLMGVTDAHSVSTHSVLKKQNWRCGMNRTLSYGAKLFAHLDPSKGVDAYRQQDNSIGLQQANDK